MSHRKAVHIRDVPEDVHRVMRTRAAAAGISLSDYLLRDLERHARRPDPDEVIERILRRPRAQGVESSTEIIRKARDSA